MDAITFISDEMGAEGQIVSERRDFFRGLDKRYRKVRMKYEQLSKSDLLDF